MAKSISVQTHGHKLTIVREHDVVTLDVETPTKDHFSFSRSTREFLEFLLCGFFANNSYCLHCSSNDFLYLITFHRVRHEIIEFRVNKETIPELF